MKIESFFPGRLRVRSELFTQSRVMHEIEAYVTAMEGIKEFTGNLKTGSITVLYDPGVITTGMLLEAKGKIEQLEQEYSRHL